MRGYPPLGSYQPFAATLGGPHPWGEGGRSSVSYHRDVLPDLIAGLRSIPTLALADMPRKAEAAPAVLAAVYRLTSREIVDALLPMHTCVIIDRQQQGRHEVDRLHRDGRPLSSAHFPGFMDLAYPDADGSRPVITPGSSMPDPIELGPVRAAGWTGSGTARDYRPLVHVKMLVAGRTWVWENDVGQEVWSFTPLRTWMGSANWTATSPSHLEFGLWSDAPDLMARNTAFLLDLVRFSQPLDSTTAGPEPDLVAADWDDAAFAEYSREMDAEGDGEPDT
jgi:hypothetical protein